MRLREQRLGNGYLSCCCVSVTTWGHPHVNGVNGREAIQHRCMEVATEVEVVEVSEHGLVVG